jgi:hypothetical protein
VKENFCTKTEKEVFFCVKTNPCTKQSCTWFVNKRREGGRRHKRRREGEGKLGKSLRNVLGLNFGCEEDEEEEEEESPKRLQFWWICLMGFGFLEDLCLEMAAAAAGGVAVVLVCTGMMRRKSTLMEKMRLVFLL